jgi:uncharacterized protein involved in exopolysaccharide biosynthesis
LDKQLILLMLRRWGWLILAATLLVTGTAFAVSQVLPPTYTAVATILVQQQASAMAAQQAAGVPSARPTDSGNTNADGLFLHTG